MIICFDCQPETKRILEKLLEEGQFRDISEVIAVALGNQMVLQERISSGGALVMDSLPEPNSTNKDSRPNHHRPRTEVQQIEPKPTEPHRPAELEAASLPELFRLGDFNGKHRTASVPDDYWVPGIPVPLDRWIFGQHNKLLPLKASCRGLAHLLMTKPKGVSLDEAAESISEAAVLLGDLLAEYDKRRGIGRDNYFSTAFPTSSDKTGKARTRYANQFIASVNKQGQVSGALIDFKLINYKPGKNPRLMLTDYGWKFARLKNSVFEGVQEERRKFTDEEIKFLLDHITRNVRAEEFAYHTIISEIRDGANTPDLLDNVLRDLVPKERSDNVTSSFLSSQRSGAVSRMSDLGLVKRLREGVRVTYLITNLGHDLMESFQVAGAGEKK